MKSENVLSFAIVTVIFTLARADLPAKCKYEEIRGVWEFQESAQLEEKPTCETMPKVVRKYHVKLDFPNLAFDREGHVGTWTMISNEGFEVSINYRKYFANSLWVRNDIIYESVCNQTLPGWSHDVLGHNWACYVGHKIKDWDSAEPLNSEPKQRQVNDEPLDLKNFISEAQVEKINSGQSLWRAQVYPDLQTKSLEELLMMAGGIKSYVDKTPNPSEPTEEVRLMASKLPKSFDWRNVSGVNYVSPVRDQQCSDCYAQSTVGMFESRVRIATGNAQKPLFSVQEIINCGPYTQGCQGGYAYLACKYAQDFGLTTEECYPYTVNRSNPLEGPCMSRHLSAECNRRTYALDFNYVGGFYGGCNEELMMLELVQNGPIVVSIYVGGRCHGLYVYESGVFSDQPHLERTSFDPYYETNHAVLVVGYGFDYESGLKYWIVKNSWGTEKGIDGYVLIERGRNVCGIESAAVFATVIP